MNINGCNMCFLGLFIYENNLLVKRKHFLKYILFSIIYHDIKKLEQMLENLRLSR